jgi:voltage-dependent potassium channel beta subunit
MEYRRLGSAGLQVSALSFGSWVTFGAQVNDGVAEQCMRLAYEQGVNFFDNAEAYASGKSEIVMGNILKRAGWERSTFVVSSKVFWGGKLPNQSGLSRKHVMEACHAALKRLQVEYLDLYFCHRPDPNTPIEETVRAMHTLIEQGKIVYWGTSEWSAGQLLEAYQVAEKLNLTPPTMEQPQYNMLHRERFEQEYKPLYAKGLGTTIWSPLASGLLTGKYMSETPKDTRIFRPGMEWLKERITGPEAQASHEKVKRLKQIADEIGVPLNRMAIAWVLKNPNVSTAILGASRAEQLGDNLKSLEVVPLLTDEVMQKIEAALQSKTVNSAI